MFKFVIEITWKKSYLLSVYLPFFLNAWAVLRIGEYNFPAWAFMW